MSRTFLVKLLEISFSLLGAGLFLWAWILHVDPFPDRDSIHQLWYPVLNYLRMAPSVGNDFSYLGSLMFDGLPSGILLIPFCITALNLNKVFIASPWLLDLFLILPLVAIFWLAPVPRERRWLFICLLFFFPPIQLVLKNLNLHSFTILYCFTGLLATLEYRKSGSNSAFIGALFCFIFACSVKHFGLILFVSMWICYLLWLRKRREPLKAAAFLGVMVILTAAFFYPAESIIPYFNTLMRHSPNLKPIWVYMMSGSMIFLFMFGWFQAVSEVSGRVNHSKYYGKVWFLLLMGALITGILAMGSDFYAPLWMFISFIFGNTILILFLRWREFGSDQGLLVLFFLFFSIVALILYSSKLGQVSALFIPPLLILLIVHVNEAEKNLNLGILAVGFVLLSNFFPSLEKLESLTGEFGFNFFSRGFNLLHQNPLGWSQAKILPQRNMMIDHLASLRYQNPMAPLLISRSGIHHHQVMALVLPEQFSVQIPPTQLLENLTEDRKRKLYASFLKNPSELYRKMATDGEIALIFEGSNRYGRYERSKLPEDLPDAGGPKERLMYSPAYLRLWFHEPYFQFIKSQNLLDLHYNRLSLGPHSEDATLYIHKKFKKRETVESQNTRLSALERNYQELVNPRLKEAQEYYQKSNALMASGRNIEAYVYLYAANELDPNHQEISKGLESLTTTMDPVIAAKLREEGFSKLLSILEENEVLPWSPSADIPSAAVEPVDEEEVERRRAEAQNLFSRSAQYFQTSPQKAIDYLKQAVSLDPSHDSAREDLNLLIKQQTKDKEKKLKSEILSRNERANQLFQESIKYFEQDPRKAQELLSQALELNPEHIQANVDLQALKDREKLTLLTPEKVEAERLFQKANKVFVSNPEQALGILKKVLELDPEHLEASSDIEIIKRNKDRDRAQILYHESLPYHTQDPRKAVLLLEEVLRLDPEHFVGRNALSKIQSYLATDSMQKALARSLTSRARMMIETNPVEAEKILKRALMIDPANEDARSILGTFSAKESQSP